MSEKEFNFQDPLPDGDPEPVRKLYPGLGEPTTGGEPKEEVQVESEDEGVREVSLVFPEEEAWPPQPSPGLDLSIKSHDKNTPVKTYSEAIEDLNREESEQGEVEQEPVRLYSGKPANSSSQSFGGVINGTELDGFFFYTIKHPTGITLNGKHFDKGPYWFDMATYEGIRNIDLPFQ
jgi:hypothetical protein